ncbi:hypothetical protein MIND_00926900 [Mycena indigotica]|uniref:Uncharacterized protein n=1 Tax=Mycena indigotica TaxID=2126181 RepID=A0A8H6SFK8_9AGAR|nr:uncharacterized protein MIND_00926900 [Mycena indigotica]KAF7296950.1 hypothetical protein MIND_00926900 [Mycena indigotica]
MVTACDLLASGAHDSISCVRPKCPYTLVRRSLNFPLAVVNSRFSNPRIDFYAKTKTKPKAASWDDQLAEKYYESLFREFAVCDLKHYNFLFAGGPNQRFCWALNEHKHKRGRLTTLELPFSYEEQGEAKSALVKTVLCEKCLGKMMWKRRKEKETSGTEERRPVEEVDDEYGPMAPTTSTTHGNRNQEEPKPHISHSMSPPSTQTSFPFTVTLPKTAGP